MTTVKHTIQRGEIFHFNHRIGGIVYRKSLKTDSPSTSRQYVSDILSFIERGKILGVSVEKEDIDQFIEMLISNKVNEIVRLTKAVTEPLSPTARSYFERWFTETEYARNYNENLDFSSSMASVGIPESEYKYVISYDDWIAKRVEDLANRDHLRQELSRYNPDEEEMELDENHQFYDDFKYPTVSAYWYGELTSIVDNHAKNLSQAHKKNNYIRFRLEVDELKSRFKSLLPEKPLPIKQLPDSALEESTTGKVCPLFEDVQEEVEAYIAGKVAPNTVSNLMAGYKDFIPPFKGLRINEISFSLLEQVWGTFVCLPNLSKAKLYGFDVGDKEERRALRWELCCNNDIDVLDQHMLGTDSIKDKKSFLNHLFKHSLREGYITENPMSVAEIQIPQNRKTQRTKIPMQYASDIVSYSKSNLDIPYSWAVLLMAYHGMRPAEVISLCKSNIILDEDTSVQYINIPDGKTSNAKRRVPIHKELLSKGFVEFVDYLPSNDSLLFNFSRQKFTNYFNQELRPMFDIPSKNQAGDLINLYGFRHNVFSQLGELSDEYKYRLLGHTTGTKVSAGYTHVDFIKAQKIINGIKY
ncbi:hypothetical protein K5N28_004177 [Vibrio parahaemolyticus]|nr:hypothetical protein [Vibrio parahaemolyticus]